MENLTNLINNNAINFIYATITFLITTFLMLWLKSLVENFVSYMRAKFSSIGEQSIIILDGKKYFVESIKFKKVKLINGDDVKFIPLDVWLKMVLTVPRYISDMNIEKKN